MNGSRPVGLLSTIRAFLRDRRALGAVEFALTAPFLILLYIGGFQLMDAISANRKVAITDRTLADLTTQYTSLTAADADSILSAARQVMTPYSTADATLIITQVAINKKGKATVDWSRSNDGSTIKNKNLDVPASIAVPNSYIILSQITFHYVPKIGGSLIGPLTFTDHIFMNPRRSNSIPCADC
jgi:Flp pilus assembly protein TadG